MKYRKGLFIFLVLIVSVLDSSLVYPMEDDLTEHFIERCEFEIRDSRFFTKSVKHILAEPKAYIEMQIREICKYPSGVTLMKGILSKLKNDKKVKFVISNEPMSGFVDEQGNGIVNINFENSIIEYNTAEAFPKIFSLLPLIQGEIKIHTEDKCFSIVEIIPDKSPFWISITHELIHIFHIFTDKSKYDRDIRLTPQDIVKAVGKDDRSYDSIVEIVTAKRLSQELWTNLEERNTVIGEKVSELTIRMEAGEKLRYIYQANDKVFCELKDVVIQLIGKDLVLPTMDVLFSESFDISLTPLSILGVLYEKQELINYLVYGESFVSCNLGKALIALKKLHLWEDNLLLADKSIKEKRVENLKVLIP